MPESSSAETIEPEEAREALAANDAVAIDIRDDDGWRSGHVPGARHIAEADLDNQDDLPDQKLIVVCDDGKRSAEVAAGLRDDGREAVALEGGMDAWRSADFAMQPSTDAEDDVPI